MRAAKLVVGLFLSVAAWVATDTFGQSDEQPNILLIVSDDQGYNDLGLLNGDIITPNLDRLAK